MSRIGYKYWHLKLYCRSFLKLIRINALGGCVCNNVKVQKLIKCRPIAINNINWHFTHRSFTFVDYLPIKLDDKWLICCRHYVEDLFLTLESSRVCVLNTNIKLKDESTLPRFITNNNKNMHNEEVFSLALQDID